MTIIDEERRRVLLLKLARRYGWHVRSWTAEQDGFIRKYIASKNWYLIWIGETWTDVWCKLLMDLEYARIGPVVPSDPPVLWFRNELPVWMIGCGSEEELILKSEALL